MVYFCKIPHMPDTLLRKLDLPKLCVHSLLYAANVWNFWLSDSTWGRWLTMNYSGMLYRSFCIECWFPSLEAHHLNIFKGGNQLPLFRLSSKSNYTWTPTICCPWCQWVSEVRLFGLARELCYSNPGLKVLDISIITLTKEVVMCVVGGLHNKTFIPSNMTHKFIYYVPLPYLSLHFVGPMSYRSLSFQKTCKQQTTTQHMQF